MALVTDWSPPRVGGVERHVAGLAAALAARGHSVHLFTTTSDASAIAGVNVHQIRTAMIGEVAAPNLWRVRELRAMLADARVDLVHAHGMFSTLAIGSLLAAHSAGLPSITTHHSLLRGSPTLPAAWLTYRVFSWRATVVTAVSRAAADDARRVSGRAEVPLLPNGLDRAMWARPPTVRLPPSCAEGASASLTGAFGGGGKAYTTYKGETIGLEMATSDRDEFAPDGDPLVRGVRLPRSHEATVDRRSPGGGRQPDRGGLQPDSEIVRVVSVMRLAAKKSPGDLIEALPAVMARVRRGVVFTIVGDGPERARLERLARRRGVAAQVEFLGACPPVEVAEILARSSVFALPSRREAFGIAVLEARAAGLPVVAYASGGIPEIVEHGRHGLLAHSPREFADAIATLVDDDVLRKGLAAVSASGLEAYDWDRVVDRHEIVYRRALASRR